MLIVFYINLKHQWKKNIHPNQCLKLCLLKVDTLAVAVRTVVSSFNLKGEISHRRLKEGDDEADTSPQEDSVNDPPLAPSQPPNTAGESLGRRLASVTPGVTANVVRLLIHRRGGRAVLVLPEVPGRSVSTRDPTTGFNNSAKTHHSTGATFHPWMEVHPWGMRPGGDFLDERGETTSCID